MDIENKFKGRSGLNEFVTIRAVSVGQTINRLAHNNMPDVFDAIGGDVADLGAGIGSSATGLRQYNPRHLLLVEDEAALIQMGQLHGFIKPSDEVIIEDCATILSKLKQNRFSCITFFGAPPSLAFEPLVENALSRLKAGGFIIFTSLEEAGESFDALQQKFGGTHLHEPENEMWDTHIYALRKKSG